MATVTAAVEVHEFKEIKLAITNRVNEFIKAGKQLFVLGIDRDLLWETYINAYPNEGGEKQHHTCSACRQFIKNCGALVTINANYELESIWDVVIQDEMYAQVAQVMKNLVDTYTIANKFLTSETHQGVDHNHQALETKPGLKDFKLIRLDHFFFQLKTNDTKHFRNKGAIGESLNDANTGQSVFKRGLEELTLDSVDTVLDLVNQKSIYTGGIGDPKKTLTEFRKLIVAYQAVPVNLKHNFTWAHADSHVARTRNTALGTLLQALSEGEEELEVAVKKFEKMVGGENYKRPTALISKAMIAQAEKTIVELGLENSLHRRAAKIEDITVNNVLYVDRSTRAKISTGSVFDGLRETVPNKPKTFDRVKEVSLDTFLADILPTANKLELYLDNRLTSGNLVSLVAPEYPDAPSLFKWDNGFSWCYQGITADSVKEKVKAAGGKVEGLLRCSLEWYNYDDLDLHLTCPGGKHIYFSNRRDAGGYLDVDENAGRGKTRTPVENIIFENTLAIGQYALWVHNYTQRENIDFGFKVEHEFQGNLLTFESAVSPVKDGRINVVSFQYTKDKQIVITKSMPHTASSKEVWGLTTNEFYPVKIAMLSPNHWDGNEGMGNKHVFFMLEGAKNDGPIRGFFNEFLPNHLSSHRKVFEALASKLNVDKKEGQEELSGVGFSTTMPNSFIVRVNTNSVQSMLKVMV